MKNLYKKKILMCGVSFKSILKLTIITILCLFNLNLQAQDLIVTGTIKDEQGNALPGVSISSTSTKTTVISGKDGKYSISVPPVSAVLIFKYLGFVDQKISVGDRRVIDVTLNPSNTELNDVVVIGYGTPR